VDDEVELIRALHDEHAHALWAYVVRLTDGDRQFAEEIVQETLLRAWRNPQVLDQSVGPARAWLFTVAKRIVIDHWRARRSRPEVIGAEPPEIAVTDGTDEAVQAWLVIEALRQLSKEHRAVLVECYYLGNSVAEAARRLQVPEGTVKSRTHYALRSLRLILEEMGVSE
jgi:RNA polymerase sigma-70 factor (ECF subfamily)